MKSNRAQGLPLNTIIIAIIVIVVLVVIILITTGQLGNFQNGLTTGNGDACANDKSERCVAGFQCQDHNNNVCGAGTVCCTTLKPEYTS